MKEVLIYGSIFFSLIALTHCVIASRLRERAFMYLILLSHFCVRRVNSGQLVFKYMYVFFFLKYFTIIIGAI